MEQAGVLYARRHGDVDEIESGLHQDLLSRARRDRRQRALGRLDAGLAKRTLTLLACQQAERHTLARARSMTVAAEASGTSTGNRVNSLTNQATDGLQNRTFTCQLPSTVVDRSLGPTI